VHILVNSLEFCCAKNKPYERKKCSSGSCLVFIIFFIVPYFFLVSDPFVGKFVDWTKTVEVLWACLDGGVSVSLKQANTKTNTFHPNTCVSLVLVGTNTPPPKLTPPRGGNWC
jgi:hypothetical protein